MHEIEKVAGSKHFWGAEAVKEHFLSGEAMKENFWGGEVVKKHFCSLFSWPPRPIDFLIYSLYGKEIVASVLRVSLAGCRRVTAHA